MNPLFPWRKTLRGLIPRGFLRRDQGQGLFVSDYPRLEGADEVTCRVRAAGFSADISAGIARIDGTPEAYRALLASLPARTAEPADETLFLCSLAKRLERSGAPFADGHIPVLREALKKMDAGDGFALYRFLAPAAALAQREHRPLPAGLGRMILCFLSPASETNAE